MLLLRQINSVIRIYSSLHQLFERVASATQVPKKEKKNMTVFFFIGSRFHVHLVEDEVSLPRNNL